MRRLLPLLLAALLLTVPALAVEEVTILDPEPEYVSPDISEFIPPEPPVQNEGVTYDVPAPPPEIPDEIPAEEDPEIPLEGDPVELLETEEAPPVVQTFTVVSVDDLPLLQSLDGGSGLADAVTSILGEYQRMTYTVEELDSDGNVLATSTQYVPGLAGLDYEWIAGAVLFALMFWGLLRLIGGLIRL